MAAAKKKSNLTEFALIFLVVYLGSQVIFGRFFPKEDGVTGTTAVTLKMQAKNVRQGNDPMVTITNALPQDLTLPARCPNAPLDVNRVEGETITALTATELAGDCPETLTIPAGKHATLSLGPWKYTLFHEPGMYELQLPGGTGTGATITGTGSSTETNQPTVRFTVTEPGVFTKLFRTFLSKPFFNFLIWSASWLPDHNLGLAIIMLTLLVKLILFFPTQKSLQGQKEMQKLQPKMEALKRQYKDNPTKLQEETMKLWKEHKVNPMQSCLPTLVQFPVLIGLFYVIRGSSHVALSQHLIYPMFAHLNWTFGTTFLGLNLLEPNWFVMPPLLMVMQFFQMKLAFTLSDRKRKKEQVIDVPSVKELEHEIVEARKDPIEAQKLQQNMMLFGLPIMIGVMAFQFPAAVSLYWGVSTLFGIGQQLVVNRKSL